MNKNFVKKRTARSLNEIGKIIFVFGIVLTLSNCSQDISEDVQDRIADTIVVNGDVKTVDPAMSSAEAFAIKDGRFLAVGSSAEIRKLAGENTQVIDAQGATVTPGFSDAHIHLTSGMALAMGVNLSDVVSKDEWIRIIEEKTATLNEGDWVLGGGWNHELSDGNLPTKEMLDAVSPNNPVFLFDIDHHSYWVNSKAIELAGITKDTEVPDSGEILFDPLTGAPTGILKEGASATITNLPGYKAASAPAIGIPLAILLANSYGITSIHDLSVDSDIRVNLAVSGELTMRIWSGRFAHLADADFPGYAAERDAVKMRLAASGHTDRGPTFEHGYTKLYADGVLSTYTALMKRPYSDRPEVDPEAIMNEDLLLRRVKESHEQGFPVAIHAIGDRGVQMSLDAFEEAGHPEGMLPDRIEHIEVATPDDVARFKSLGIAASMQPIHATCCVGDYVMSRVGEERIPNVYSWRRMLDHGIHLSLSSDWSTSPLNPLEHIAMAMKRETNIDGTMSRWDDARQALTFEEALYAYTQSSADLTPWGDQIGSITIGKWADFVIMDTKIDVSDADSVVAANVLSTYLAGETIYQK